MFYCHNDNFLPVNEFFRRVQFLEASNGNFWASWTLCGGYGIAWRHNSKAQIVSVFFPTLILERMRLCLKKKWGSTKRISLFHKMRFKGMLHGLQIASISTRAIGGLWRIGIRVGHIKQGTSIQCSISHIEPTTYAGECPCAEDSAGFVWHVQFWIYEANSKIMFCAHQVGAAHIFYDGKL